MTCIYSLYNYYTKHTELNVKQCCTSVSEKKYIIQVFYEPKQGGGNYWNAKFAVAPDINALTKVSL